MRGLLAAVCCFGVVAGCGRPAPPDVAVAAADDLDPPIPPDPPLPPDAPIPDLPPDPPPTFADTGHRNVRLSGDPADPTFAGRKLSEWRADLVPPPPDRPTNFPAARRALRALECYGPHAIVAIPAVVALSPGVEVDPQLWKSMGRRAAVPLLDAAVAADDRTVYRALAGLAALGPDAAPALARLVALADHPRPRLRSSYPSILQHLGPAARPAVPKLVKLLDDPAQRRAAAAVLLKVDPAVSAGIPYLIPEQTKSPFSSLPSGALAAYGRRLARPLVSAMIGPDGNGPFRKDLTFLLPHLKDDASGVIPDLVRFARTRPAGEAVPVLTMFGSFAGLSSPKVMEAARRQAEGLLACAADTDVEKSVAAIAVAHHFGDDAAPFAAHAARHVEDPRHGLYVVMTLRRFGPAARDAIPALLRAAANPKVGRGARSLALLTAAKAGAAPAELLPIAQDLSNHPLDRILAVPVLRGCGPDGVNRAAEVMRLIDANPSVDGNSSYFYGLLGEELPDDPVALRLAIRGWTHGQPYTTGALFYLAKLPASAEPALRTLMRGGSLPAAADLFVRNPRDEEAVRALNAGGPKDGALYEEALVKAGAAAVPLLMEMLRVPHLRHHAAVALLKLAPDVELPTGPLAAAVQWDSRDYANYRLLLALGRCGERARAELATVRAALGSRSRDVALAAAQVLAALDPADRAGVPFLLRAALGRSTEGMVGDWAVPVVLRPEPTPGPGDGSHTVAMYGPIPPPSYSARRVATQVLMDIDPEAAITGGVFDEPRDRW